jgi:hypothetical protein
MENEPDNFEHRFARNAETNLDTRTLTAELLENVEAATALVLRFRSALPLSL